MTRISSTAGFIAALAAAAIIGGSSGCAFRACMTESRPSPPRPAAELELDVASFDTAWATIRDKYFDPTLAGLDWEAIRDELRPRVLRAADRRQTRSVILDMISRLGASHGGLIPEEQYRDSGGEAGVPGIEIERVEGRIAVTGVARGCPAEHAGIRDGWIISGIGGVDADSLLAALDARVKASSWKEQVVIASVFARMCGTPGDSVSLRLIDGSDRTVTRRIALVEERGEKVARPGDAAPLRVWFESRLEEDGIGYVRFNLFEGPAFMMSRFNDAIGSFMGARGIIVDLRGNGGGLGAMAVWMAGWFIDSPGRSLGVVETRSARSDITVMPRAETYKGPLAVLVDEATASTAEIFAQGLKDLGRAVVVGRCSAGASLPSDILRLPNGDRLVYPVARHLSSVTGEPVEGRGIVPDIDVRLSRKALLEGRDETIEAAARWIEQGSSGGAGIDSDKGEAGGHGGAR